MAEGREGRKEGRAALRKQNWINMPSGPRDGTQRPSTLNDRITRDAGNEREVTTRETKGEGNASQTGKGRGNKSLSSRFDSFAPWLNNPIFHWLKSPLQPSLVVGFVDPRRWNFRKWRDTLERKERKKERNGEKRGLWTNADRITRRVVVKTWIRSRSSLCTRRDLISRFVTPLRDYNMRHRFVSCVYPFC